MNMLTITSGGNRKLVLQKYSANSMDVSVSNVQILKKMVTKSTLILRIREKWLEYHGRIMMKDSLEDLILTDGVRGVAVTRNMRL